MKSTKYLFDIEAGEFENKFYTEVLKIKIEAGMKLFQELHGIERPNFEERERLFYVTKALDFTRDLLEELKETT